MNAIIRIRRAAPLTTVQDWGRPNALGYGIAASGPMDSSGWAAAKGASSGIEFTLAGLEFGVESGETSVALAGGTFTLSHNGKAKRWPARLDLKAGDLVSVTPGEWGNYGYARFSGDIDVAPVLGSRATNTIVGLGGLAGRALKTDDVLTILDAEPDEWGDIFQYGPDEPAPIRVMWGLHADLFTPILRANFVESPFPISTRLDRMGVRLADPSGVFSGAGMLSLVSDSVVPGDIQILGDSTPIVLMRDHQPTGGYPRIATVISADLSRFAQMRPGSEVRFVPVSQARAEAILRAEWAL